MGPSSGRKYKIRLDSGRVLGPLDLERIRLLVLKSRIVGGELAREHPNGEWKSVSHFPEIAQLILAKVEGRLSSEAELKNDASEDGAGFSYTVLPGSTQVLKESLPASPPPSRVTSPISSSISPTSPTTPASNRPIPVADAEEEEKTIVSTSADQDAHPRWSDENSESKTLVSLPDTDSGGTQVGLQNNGGLTNWVADAETIVLQNAPQSGLRGKKSSLQRKNPGSDKPDKLEKIKAILAAVALGLIGYELLLQETPKKPTVSPYVAIRPMLPPLGEGPANPQASGKIYQQAMRSYVQDTVVGYKTAADLLRVAVAQDSGNVKALAMLASSYLNLIDSSNKDENYFAVISKLIEMSRAKNVDLPETVIADVEYYLTANKPEAAQQRIVDYTKTHQDFDIVMFHYLSQTFLLRGDAQSAARYISNFPENKVFSPKVFYLKGQIAEKLNDLDMAFSEYNKALRVNPSHAKSRLRISAILQKKGRLGDAGPQLDFIVENPHLLPPKELALGYYLHAQASQLHRKFRIALGDMERANRLDRDNHDYLLELFTLRAKDGESSENMKAEARMYYFLSEGERKLREGKQQEALTQFLQARQANDRSSLPPIKIGDMFFRLNDMNNARLNYKLAAERAPNNIDVWSKYISALIQSYEWEEAQKAMDRFRKLPVPQSAIDKAAADMYAKQNRHAEAQVFYRKAMSREYIDPAVYISYAKSLSATRNCKEAPFFFALALRFDPLNAEALIGTAKCIAETESIDRAISMLRDEIQKGSAGKAELLTAVAELQIQKGDWEPAQATLEQAMAASADYGYPWKLQAQIHMNKEGIDRNALDKALSAYQSYSERNSSDPSGYLERYRIFIRKAEFEKAGDELRKIYAVFPKYPNLHYYKGALYSVMGNHKTAVEEFKKELKNNPTSVTALVSLGKALIETGGAQEALAYLNKAVQLAPKSPQARLEAGYANFLLKNYAGAIALYQAALLYDKGNPLIYKRLGMAYRDLGDLKNAAFSFRKYIEMEPDAPDRAEYERYR